MKTNLYISDEFVSNQFKSLSNKKFTHGKLYSMLPGICENSISLTKSARWALVSGAKLIDKSTTKASIFILKERKIKPNWMERAINEYWSSYMKSNEEKYQFWLDFLVAVTNTVLAIHTYIRIIGRYSKIQI